MPRTHTLYVLTQARSSAQYAARCMTGDTDDLASGFTFEVNRFYYLCSVLYVLRSLSVVFGLNWPCFLLTNRLIKDIVSRFSPMLQSCLGTKLCCLADLMGRDFLSVSAAQLSLENG